jgi:hypothetical protein
MVSPVRNVKLELLRPGPAHNQLLSPLTPYIALCGAAGPATVMLPFEHRQLLSRLQRLRYSTASGEIPTEQRAFEARDMGESLGHVLGQVPSLATEIGCTGTEEQGLVHLRLSVSALELAIVPFELAVAPEGFPGSGSPLFLQSTTPITITREVRRGRKPGVHWNRKPRILFAFAQPGNLAAVPYIEHLNALRRAVDPWVKWAADEKQQVDEVKAVLTVLPNATIERIREECLTTEYTHIHILAHGVELDAAEQRFGLALCDQRDPKEMHRVDGETLALALTGVDQSDGCQHLPTLVSLATCDSGQVGSVVTPGGSIAHELNAAGIPWVVASQFPLWMRPSTIAVEELYTGLLRGEDPRWVLYQLRKRLRTDSASTHDWASIVAYAAVPWDFERQLTEFHNRYRRTVIDGTFDHAEKLVAQGAANPPRAEDPEPLYARIRQDLAQWCAETESKSEKAERLGMWAASEKRIGTLHAQCHGPDSQEARAAYQRSCEKYEKALEVQPTNHWVLTQFLSMQAILAAPENYGALEREYNFAWVAARQLAKWDLKGATGEQEAWALGTLAELELLGCVYGASTFDPDRSRREIEQLCQRICESVGDEPFPILSTRRQFQRYLKNWPREIWDGLARAAVLALPEEGSRPGKVYLGPATG